MSETTIVDRDAVLAYLVTWLRENTDKQIGDGDVPKVSTLQFPYAVVHLIGTQAYGPWADPDVDLELVIQITCVGTIPPQVRYMSDMIRARMIGRDADSNYAYPMLPEGFSVAHRWASGLGATVKSGDRLYESPDTYRIKVVPQA